MAENLNVRLIIISKYKLNFSGRIQRLLEKTKNIELNEMFFIRLI